MTFSLFGGGALETELNLTMKSAVVGVIITSVTDGWDGGSKKKKNPTKNVQGIPLQNFRRHFHRTCTV